LDEAVKRAAAYRRGPPSTAGDGCRPDAAVGAHQAQLARLGPIRPVKLPPPRCNTKTAASAYLPPPHHLECRRAGSQRGLPLESSTAMTARAHSTQIGAQIAQMRPVQPAAVQAPCRCSHPAAPNCRALAPRSTTAMPVTGHRAEPHRNSRRRCRCPREEDARADELHRLHHEEPPRPRRAGPPREESSVRCCRSPPQSITARPTDVNQEIRHRRHRTGFARRRTPAAAAGGGEWEGSGAAD
jgi:hypothetical protein